MTSLKKQIGVNDIRWTVPAAWCNRPPQAEDIFSVLGQYEDSSTHEISNYFISAKIIEPQAAGTSEEGSLYSFTIDVLGFVTL